MVANSISIYFFLCKLKKKSVCCDKKPPWPSWCYIYIFSWHACFYHQNFCLIALYYFVLILLGLCTSRHACFFVIFALCWTIKNELMIMIKTDLTFIMFLGMNLVSIITHNINVFIMLALGRWVCCVQHRPTDDELSRWVHHWQWDSCWDFCSKRGFGKGGNSRRDHYWSVENPS